LQLGHTNLFTGSWIAGSLAHLPRLGGRKKIKIKNVTSRISEQQEENMIFPRLPLL
jgi:hypothetical protein